jgi:hypothetical protein
MLVTGTSIVAAFFDVMDQRLKEQGFRTIVYQPEDQFTGPLEQGAAGIAEAVKAAIAQTGATKIDILAECNGGVASRFFVEQLGGDAYVDRLVTFVSAHHGTEWAKLGLNPALRDITPGSPFLAKLNSREGVPTATRETSVYICTDEIMKPYTTSRVAGALNVAVCDPELDRRTAERTPYDVKDDMGNALIKNYPIHLTGFWDEQFYRLLVSCLIDSEEDVRRFDGLAVAFE